SGSTQRGDRQCSVSLGNSGSPIHGKSQRCRLGHVISCVQSQLITWDMYTDHHHHDDQCALIDQCGPRSATCQCPSVPAVSAEQCHVPVPISATSMPHISAYQCTSMPHISAHLSCPSVPPISASQCHLSVPPISAASQCRLSVPVSAA
ncbi:unnamed protein product, partial [Staurois parvus]